jgi:protein-tyrosine-phosphatase
MRVRSLTLPRRPPRLLLMNPSRRPFNILFVCTGNICRSPMAVGILESVLSPQALVVAKISSAGTGAMTGMPASENSVRVCEEEGIDISRHRSRAITRHLLETSDLVLAMEKHHAEAMRRLAPDLGDRIHLLSQYAADGNPAVQGGVPDPIGGDLEDYRLIFAELRDQIRAALPRLEREIAEAPVEP